MKVESFKRFSLKMLHCEARAFPVCTAYGYMLQVAQWNRKRVSHSVLLNKSKQALAQS